MSFLFRGDQPLLVQPGRCGGEIGTYEIVPPMMIPASREELLGQWWTGYTDAARRQIDAADYPPWVETYLVAMLSGRVGLPLPDWYRRHAKNVTTNFWSTLKLIGGAPKRRRIDLRRAAAGSPASNARRVAAASRPAAMGDRCSLRTILATSRSNRWQRVFRRNAFTFATDRSRTTCGFAICHEEFGGDISRMVSVRGINEQHRRANRRSTESQNDRAVPHAGTLP